MANPEENLDLFKQTFMIKPVKWEKLKKKLFFNPKWQHTAKLCFFFFFKLFRGNSQRTYLFGPKIDYLRKEPRYTQKFVCLYNFEMGKILRKIWICLNKHL